MFDKLVSRIRFACEIIEGPTADLLTEAVDAIEELQAGEKKFLRNISALEMENENFKRAGRWISVTERLPEENKYVLVRYANNDMAVACVFERDEHMTFWRAMIEEGWCADCETEPTHWMPLPEPPKEEKI